MRRIGLDEAEIEHLVDLVENEEFDRVQVATRASRWSSRRPGVATSTSRPLRQRADLGAVRHAAEDDGDVERQAGREVAEALRRSGWRARASARARERAPPPRGAGRLSAIRRLQDRQREGRRLAGAGLGDADQVASVHQDGNGLGLDGRRLGVAHLGQRGDERRGEAEAVEIFQE